MAVAVAPVTTLAGDSERQQSIVARIERLPFHSWHVKMLLIVGSATFFDSFDTVMIAYILPVLIVLWHIKPTQIGLLISAGYLGQLLGSLIFGWVAEKKGRLPSLITCVVVFSAASLLCMLSWCYAAMFVFRFIQGAGLGGEVPIAATYINELVKAKGRGKFVMLYESLFSVGMVLCAGIAWWAVPRFGWRVMFLIGALIGLALPLFQRRLPESPRWLSGQKRFDEAETIVSQIENVVSENGRRPLPPPKIVATAPDIRKMHFGELFKGIYRRRTITIWILWFCTFFCYFGMVTWLPSLYTSVFKVSLKTAISYGLLVQFATLFGSLACAFVIDIFGRVKLYAGAYFLTFLSIVVFLLSGTPSVHGLVILSCFVSFLLSCVATSLFLYTPEIYPTRMRALGCSIGTAWYRVAVIIAPILVGVIVGRYHSVPYIFGMFGVISAIAGVVTVLFAVETKGRILEEVSP